MEALVSRSLMEIGAGSAMGLRPFFVVFALGLSGVLIPDNSSGTLAFLDGHIPTVIQTPWVLGIVAFLAVGEFVVDWIPAVRETYEVIGSVLRPVLSLLVGTQFGGDAGMSAAAGSTALAGTSALATSLGKTATTTVLSVIPGAGILRSLSESAQVVVLMVCVILFPILAGVLGVVAMILGIVLFILLRRAYKSMRAALGRMNERRRNVRELRRAQIASGERVSAMETLRRLTEGLTPAMATGMAAPGGAVRTAGTATADWTKTTARNAAAVGSAGAGRVASAATSAYRAAQNRISSFRQQSAVQPQQPPAQPQGPAQPQQAAPPQQPTAYAPQQPQPAPHSAAVPPAPQSPPAYGAAPPPPVQPPASAPSYAPLAGGYEQPPGTAAPAPASPVDRLRDQVARFRANRPRSAPNQPPSDDVRPDA